MIGVVRVKMLKGEKGDAGVSGDYSTIENKPAINGITLDGDQTGADLGLAGADAQHDLQVAVNSINSTLSNVQQQLLVTGAYVITADYDPDTHIFSNLSGTAADVYTAVHDQHRPCVIVGTDTINRLYVASCFYSASTAAYFCMKEIFGDTMNTWLLSGSQIIYVNTNPTGVFTQNDSIVDNVMYADIVCRVGICVVNIWVSLKSGILPGTYMIGTISNVPIPQLGVTGPCVYGKANEGIDNFARFTLDNNGNLTVYTGAEAAKAIALSFSYPA